MKKSIILVFLILSIKTNVFSAENRSTKISFSLNQQMEFNITCIGCEDGVQSTILKTDTSLILTSILPQALTMASGEKKPWPPVILGSEMLSLLENISEREISRYVFTKKDESCNSDCEYEIEIIFEPQIR